MAKTSSENNDFKKILTHLTALDKKVDEGHKNLAALDEKVDKGFKEAAEDRQAIRNEVQVMRHGMQLGFKSAEEFQRKTEENFAGLYREIPEVGNMAYKHRDAHHEDFLKFQQQALAFQQETRAFHEKSENFQNDTRHAFQEISRILARIESKQIIIEETFKKLKTENEELKKAKAEHETTIKRLEQRVAALEAMQA